MTVALSRQNLRKWIENAIRKFRNNDLLGVPEAWLKIYEALADYICDERKVDTKLLWMMEGTNDSPADIIYQLQRLKNALTKEAAKAKTLEELLPVLSWFDNTIVVLVEKASGQISTKRSLLAPYETIFWNARDGMYISTIDGKFIHCNEALLNMFHFKRVEDLLEMDIKNDLYVDQEARQVMLDHLLEDGFFDKHEFRFQCSDGKMKTALESCFLVNTPSGKPYIVGVLVDVTQEREAQRKNQDYLEEIEKQGVDANLRLTHEIKRYEALLNVNDHPVLLVEVRHFSLVDANMAFHKRFRYGKKQLEGTNFRNLFPNEDWNRLYSTIVQSLHRHHYHVNDINCQNAQGEPFNANLSILVQRDESGPLLFVQIEDQTDHIHIASQRERSRQNLRKVMDSVPVGVIGFRNDGSVALVGKHFLEKMGYSRRKMMNLSFINELFMKEEQRLKFHKYLKQFISGNHARRVSVSLKNSSDQVLDFQLSTVSYQFDDDEKPGCLAILDEVTDKLQLKQLQKQLKTKPEERDNVLEQLETKLKELELAQVDLKRQLGVKQTFIHQITEKFQDPIEVVLGYASFLQQSLQNKLDASQTEDLRIIHDHIQIMLTMLENVREYSLLESGNLEATPDPHIVRQLLDDLFERLSPDDLPEGVEFQANHQILSMDWQIFIDLNILESLLHHLLRNAKSYTSKGQIQISASEDNGRLCIEVKDSGQGIRPTDLPRVQEPFYPPNANDPRTGMPRLGLGLAIVDEYVKLLQGEWEIQSKWGAGTKVLIWLNGA